MIEKNDTDGNNDSIGIIQCFKGKESLATSFWGVLVIGGFFCGVITHFLFGANKDILYPIQIVW